MLVIVNPYATTMSVRLKQLVVYALQGRFEVEAVDTQRKGHAIELCREAADEGYDVVVAFGGDGTVNEAANGLAGSDTVLTCLPGGATNVYCRMLGIPTDVVDATEHLLGARRRAGSRAPSTSRASTTAGSRSPPAPASTPRSSSASTATRASRPASARGTTPRRRSPRSWRSTSSTRRAWSPPPAGARREGVSVFVQNAQPYTYFRRRPIQLADGTRPAVRRPLGRRARPAPTRSTCRRSPSGCCPGARRVGGHRRVHAFDGLDGLRVRSADDRPVPVQVDGDYIGTHEEAVFSVLPGGLNVLG